MSYIYNVSARVGWVPGCPNNPDDVQLVHFLLQENCKRTSDLAKGSWDIPFPNGTMDAVTGFWIFVQQRGHRKSQTMDGVVSPAQGVHYGSMEWTIVSLNSDYRTLYGDQAFQDLPNSPGLGPTLNRALQAGS